MKFTNSTKLRIHTRIHSSEKPFSCQYCSKTFRMSYHRDVHSARHTHTGKYKCQLCNRSFPQASEYRRHQLVHKEKKPTILKSRKPSNTTFQFQCPNCDENFKSWKLLKKHIYNHCEVALVVQAYSRYKNLEDLPSLERKTVTCGSPVAVLNPAALPVQNYPDLSDGDDIMEGETALINLQQQIGNNLNQHINNINVQPAQLGSGLPTQLPLQQQKGISGISLQNISVKTEKFRTIDDTIMTKTVYVMDPDVPDSDNTSHPGVSSLINLPYTLGVPQYRSDKEVGATIVIPGSKFTGLPEQDSLLHSIHQYDNNS